MATFRAMMSMWRPAVPSKVFGSKASSSFRSFNVASRNIVTLELVAKNPRSLVQVYLSRTDDPFVNLSIEHFLLTKTPVDAKVLFLYTNRPCIVLGRNQNPWVEVNNGLLNKKVGEVDQVHLVRRRSGGGTVFHDEGNVNYSVVFPTSSFDRDVHAHMVVRALQSLGVSQANVNERHDIVLAQQSKDSSGTTTKEAALPLVVDTPLKVSGSAYKLTSKKSLHHGTCLLSSPNIKTIGKYLKSPAKPFISAFGTPSVRSPITNVNVSNNSFEKAVVAEFQKLYGAAKVIEIKDCQATGVAEIAEYLREQVSDNFTYEKTPQFKFSNVPTEDDSAPRPLLPQNVLPGSIIQFTARWGVITESFVSVRCHGFERSWDGSLVGQKIHEIHDWNEVLKARTGELKPLADWMNSLFR